MIFLLFILLLALVAVVCFSKQLMDAFGPTFKEAVTGKVTYATIERNMSDASLKYMDKYYKNDVGAGTITILSSNLLEYHLLNESDCVTSENDTCTGYVLIRKNKDSLVASPYVTCNDYETQGYQSWRMGE